MNFGRKFFGTNPEWKNHYVICRPDLWCFFTVLIAAVLALTSAASADTVASPERAKAAIGHYARARTLLVQALDEFEAGRRLARPDLLLDSEEWRLAVVSRAEELNRVLDPQPRVTRSGIRFKATARNIGRINGRRSKQVRASNSYGESQRTLELKAAEQFGKTSGMESSVVGEDGPFMEIPGEGMPDETLDVPSDAEGRAGSASMTDERKQPESIEEDMENMANEDLAEAPTQESGEEEKSSLVEESEEDTSSEAAALAEEDPAVSGAIQTIINERIKKMRQEKAAEAAQPKPTSKSVERLFADY